MYLPIPTDGRLRNVTSFGPAGYTAQYRHLRFIVTTAEHEDGGEWLHLSVSRRDKGVPTYDDMQDLKRLCSPDDRTGIEVFAAGEKHINLNEVRHIWVRLDTELLGGPLPDFGSLGTI
jgi:hypothetical protein